MQKLVDFSLHSNLLANHIDMYRKMQSNSAHHSYQLVTAYQWAGFCTWTNTSIPGPFLPGKVGLVQPVVLVVLVPQTKIIHSLVHMGDTRQL